MIEYVKRQDIDIDKYDRCIENSINSRIYAYSWYLDIVADNWDALVLGDYEAVMPLPWRSKYFIKYIYPPSWTQQLGVFSNSIVEGSLVQKFIKSIPKKFKKVTIQFNSGNDLSLFKTKERTNYILKLDRTYEEIYKGFNKNRRRNLKVLNNYNLSIDEFVEPKLLISLFKREKKDLKLHSNDDYQKLLELIDISKTLGIGSVSGCFDSGILIGAIFKLHKNDRIIYLFSSTDRLGKKFNAITKLVDNIIKTSSCNSMILDFEGSMNIGIAKFFESFGAIKESYRVYQSRF